MASARLSPALYGRKDGMRKSGSLPTLTQNSWMSSGAGSSVYSTASSSYPRSSPLQAAQTLCTVSVGDRRVRREEVHSVDGRPELRLVSESRLSFVAPEKRGKAPRRAAAGERLPPLEDVLDSFSEMGLQLPGPGRREKRRAGHAGFQPYRQGPRLPVRRTAEQQQQQLEDSLKSPAGGGLAGMARTTVPELTIPGGALLSPGSSLASARKGTLSPSRLSARQACPANILSTTMLSPRPPLDSAGTQKENFPWTTDAVRTVFSSFDTDRDGEVHKEELTGMLRALGCRPQPQDAEDLSQQQTQYSTLSYEEFLEFLQRYYELDISRLREQFEMADVSKDGSIDLQELHALLNRLGYALTTQATVEALEELDKDLNEKLSFTEFQGLRDYLHQNEGMTKADCVQLRELFSKVEKDAATTPKECWRICNYLGYPIQERDFNKMVAELECDSTGMAWADLLKIIRRIREKERENLKSLIGQYGYENEQGQYFPNQELGAVLADFGYTVSEETIFECLDKFEEVEDENYLTIDELALFLREYRKVEGFTSAEIAEFEQVFLRQAGNQNGLDDGMEGLDTLATGRVLRWFGVSATLQQVQQLLEQLDFDGSGRLEFNEFVKMMRRVYQEEAAKVRKLFDQLDQDKIGYITIATLPNAVMIYEGAPGDQALVSQAMEKAGLRDKSGIDVASRRLLPNMKKSAAGMSFGKSIKLSGKFSSVVTSMKDAPTEEMPTTPDAKKGRTPRGFASRRGFQEFFRQWRKGAVDEARRRAGYSSLEVSRLRQAFQSFDKDNSGTIERTEFRDLIATYFPDATRSREGQQEVQRMLKEVDGDANGDLDFQEFLQLLRKCDDRRDQHDIMLEKEVMTDCSFTQEEVDGFRSIFSASVGWTGELDLDMIFTLLGQVIDISAKQMEQLAELVMEVHPHNRAVARFPQFLRLLKRLTQDNYGGVNSSAAKQLAGL